MSASTVTHNTLPFIDPHRLLQVCLQSQYPTRISKGGLFLQLCVFALFCLANTTFLVFENAISTHSGCQWWYCNSRCPWSKTKPMVHQPKHGENRPKDGQTWSEIDPRIIRPSSKCGQPRHSDRDRTPTLVAEWCMISNFSSHIFSPIMMSWWRVCLDPLMY